MKKLILLIVLLWPLSGKAIGANAYVVMEQNTQRVLESKNMNKQGLIASITKIMTCIIALENGDIEKEVEVDDTITKAYGSGIYIQKGEKIILDDLLYGLMLRSGNDAALMIAKSVAGNVDSFVYLMNEKAKQLGMNNTKFVNPTGLEENNGEGNLSTPYDMALLTRYAMLNENYQRYVKTKEITVKSSMKTYKWKNKNKLLFSYENCTGGKTGFTKKAHRTLVTTASKDNMNLIIVTINDGNDFSDHRLLYDKYFKDYESKKVLDKKKALEKNLYVQNDFYMMLKSDDKVKKKVIKKEGVNFKYGQIAGEVEIYINDKLVNKLNLYYKDKAQEDFVSKIIEFLSLWEKI